MHVTAFSPITSESYHVVSRRSDHLTDNRNISIGECNMSNEDWHESNADLSRKHLLL